MLSTWPRSMGAGEGSGRDPTGHRHSAPFSAEGRGGDAAGLGAEGAAEPCGQQPYQTAWRDEISVMGWHEVLPRMQAAGRWVDWSLGITNVWYYG